MIRVLTGQFKNTILKSHNKIKPIPGMVRKAVMDMFRVDITNGVIGDFFAGSGSFGIEALSNGAKKAVFFEKDSDVIKVLKYNLTKLKLENYFNIVKIDLLMDIKRVLLFDFDFSVSFLSPPFILYKEQYTLQKLINLSNRIAEKSNVSILQFPTQLYKFLLGCFQPSVEVKQYVKNYGDNSILIRRRVE